MILYQPLCPWIASTKVVHSKKEKVTLTLLRLSQLQLNDIMSLPIELSFLLYRSYRYSVETILTQSQIKREAQKQRNDQNIQKCADLKTNPQPVQLKAVELAGERGASAWITTLPLREFGFDQHKRAYRDALTLRYGWPPQGLPTTCVCGSHFSVEHALSFPIIHHNEIRDLTASLLTEVCHDVSVELELQPTDEEWMSNATANSSPLVHSLYMVLMRAN